RMLVELGFADRRAAAGPPPGIAPRSITCDAIAELHERRLDAVHALSPIEVPLRQPDDVGNALRGVGSVEQDLDCALRRLDGHRRTGRSRRAAGSLSVDGHDGSKTHHTQRKPCAHDSPPLSGYTDSRTD